MTETIRTFSTGATRDTDRGKLDFEGFLSPLVLERYAQYLHKHRLLPDGSTREADNWQQGIPLQAYMKSKWRHFMDTWTLHRGYTARDRDGNPVDQEEALCAELFNTMGYLHEKLKLDVHQDPLRDWLPSGAVLYHQTIPREPDTPIQTDPQPSALDKLRNLFSGRKGGGSPDST